MELQGGRAFLLVVLASTCYVSTCAKNLIVIIPNTEICKVLDHTFVQNYTCRSKNVNRTLNLGSKELIFKPGVTLTNYHVSEEVLTGLPLRLRIQLKDRRFVLETDDQTGTVRFVLQIDIGFSSHTLCISRSQAHVILYRKFATVYRQFMIDVHFDSCAFRVGKKTNVTQVISLDGRLKYGNFWEPCPLSGRRYEHNVPMGKLAVDIFPSGEYRVDTRAYTIVNGERKYLILTQSYGEVKYTTIEYWKKK